MLYDEFLQGTGAVMSDKAHEQYLIIEKMYSACEDMTKADAYKVWKQTYGKQAKKDREAILTRIKALSEYRDHDGPATDEEMSVRRQLFQTGQSLIETSQFAWGNASIMTPDGVVYAMDKIREVNGHRVCRLSIRFELIEYPTFLFYSNGSFWVRNPDSPWVLQ